MQDVEKFTGHCCCLITVHCTGYTHPLLMYLSLQFNCAFLYLVCIQFWQEFCIDKHQQCNGMTLSNDTFLPNFHFIYHSRWMPRMMLENWCNISLWCSCLKNLFQKRCKMGVMMFRTMLRFNTTCGGGVLWSTRCTFQHRESLFLPNVDYFFANLCTFVYYIQA